MKKILFLFLSLSLIMSVFSVTAFATETSTEATLPPSDETVVYPMGDADGNLVISADDARTILRYVVDLDTLEPEELIRCDMDLSGKMEAADARLALRVSVGLETTETHAFTVTQTKESTCSQNGFVKGKCLVCQIEADIELPLAGHTPTAEPCSEDGKCIVCGADVKVNASHNMSGVKCTLCGYFDKKAAYDFMYDYVHSHGVYEAPDFCCVEDTPEMTLGLYYDTELELLYLGSNFYLVDENDIENILAAYNVFLDFGTALDSFTSEIIVFYGNESLAASYRIDASELNMNEPGAITEIEYDGPEELRQAITLDCEAVLTSIITWFDDFAARNNFGFNSFDMGFVSM